MSASLPVPWHRRLSIRLPVLLALTLLAFDLLGERIQGFVFQAFGLPGPGEAVVMMGSRSVHMPIGVLGGSRILTEELLSGARRVGAGHWQPSSEALARAASHLRVPLSGFLWTTTELEVLSATDALADRIGTTWVPPAGAPGDDFLEHAAPVFREGELAGWLVTRDRFPPIGELNLKGLPFPIFDEPKEVLDAEEFDRVRGRMELLARSVSFAVILATAALLGALLSRLITVRLNRLAEVAALPLDDGGLSVGTLTRPASGRDEISMLDQALHDARARVVELVGKLEERDTERREWVTQVAHDLRTPLTALLACLERAEDVVEDPETTRDALLIARQDAERVCELVEDLLDAARLDVGTSLEFETILGGELVDRVVRGLGPLADARNVRLEASVPPDLPSLEGDGRRLLRVFENLVRNALRHAHTRVRLEVTREEAWLQFVVLDDGPGFAREATRRDPDSAGLGLIIARRIVEAHRGTLDLENQPEGGARVRVRLPLAR